MLWSVGVQQESLHSRDVKELARTPSVKRQLWWDLSKQATTFQWVSYPGRRGALEGSSCAHEHCRHPGSMETHGISSCHLTNLLGWAFCWFSKHGLKTGLGDLILARAYFECLSCTSPMKITWNKIPSRRRKGAFVLSPSLFLIHHKVPKFSSKLRGEFTSSH